MTSVKKNKASISITKQTYPNFEDLKQSLIDFGYDRVQIVLKPGEFCVRGGIIDIFSYNHKHPMRLEYFGSDLDRLCTFSVSSQRTIANIEETVVHATQKHALNFLEFIDLPETEHLYNQLTPGDYVVHETYGIGIYKGLKHLVIGRREGDFIHIEYANEDKVYVPFEQMGLVHKYSGPENPKIGKLHDGSWNKTVKKAEKTIVQLAENVITSFKIRQSKPGFACEDDTEEQLNFEQAFPYTETPDQLSSIQDVKQDMEKTAPMDRLLCGDVGYGKTEIILRAAFKAIQNKKQVAVLAPTTLLAEQHFQTFTQRLKGFKCKTIVASRMQQKTELKKHLAELKLGNIDIIIGTHRLLQKDVVFKDLGLLVVDEEQRFGVSHKEKIKTNFPLVDVLSVSATPIPRTLYLALSGARDVSLIKTPPTNRKPVFTYVSAFEEAVIKEAVKTEMSRQGQIFYLYNNVQSMDLRMHTLSRLFPKLNIEMAHGQMDQDKLKDIFTRFKNNDTHILLCSTIIESGLDLPNANTIIVERADKLGLSQVHQLRGRVGRSNIQSYAYLMYDPQKITEKGKQRLRAIQAYAALGSGYQLALKDLDIRGSGTLLGNKQHGHMTNVGFELYCKLLESAVKKIKNEPVQTNKPIRFSADIMTYFPDNYIPCENVRLSIYQRLLNVKTAWEIDDLVSELEDRFGPMPELIHSFITCIKAQCY